MLLLYPFLSSYAQELNDTVKTNKLDEIVIVAKDPISEKYSVIKLNKIDIYLNPASNADPLKAITILPSSTNTEETANPELRGGSSDRTRVYINGVPVLNPVRNGRDNGLGNFSLFNTELIKKQYVYASNPPLSFSNSSAGLVEIETNDKLDSENIQISSALSNFGLLLNKKISNQDFIQIYGNYQFDNLFIGLNKKSLENLNSFSSIDIGLNSRIQLVKNIYFNSYNYFIDENYNVSNNSFNFNDNAIASKKRFFSVNNIDYLKNKSKIRYSSLFDYNKSNYSYGTINSITTTYQFFNSIYHKYRISNELTIQYGSDISIFKNKYDETLPLFFYSLNDYNLIYENSKTLDFFYIEPYIFTKYDFNHNFGVSSAIRKNVFLDKSTESFTSYQLSSNFNFNKSRFIFSLGKYHSYSTPNYYIRNYSLLSSSQISLDYYYEKGKMNFSSAIYYKSDKGEISTTNFEKYDKTTTFGTEINLNISIINNISLGLSNIYMIQKRFLNSQVYKSNLNLKYFIKAQIIYNNPSLFSSSLVFSTRPGNNYTPIISSAFNQEANNFEPIFGTLNSESFNDYKRLDFSINKIFRIKRDLLIAFFSINNLFNNKNESSAFYNNNFTNIFFENYQKRTLYLGLQLRLNKH